MPLARAQGVIFKGISKNESSVEAEKFFLLSAPIGMFGIWTYYPEKHYC